MRHKVRLVAQGFCQRLGIDYEETYSFVTDAITFRFLINLVASEGLDKYIYMKILKEFKIPKVKKFKHRSLYSLKL